MRWILVALISAPLFAEARLGETEAELVARFGKPQMRARHNVIAQGRITELGPQLHFREGDWRIVCDLFDGRCMRITYSKRGDWTEDQFQTVLNANGQGSRWSETTKKGIEKLQRSWRRADGSEAKWSAITGITLTWEAYNRAKATAEERARVEASRKPKI